jgi:hypothetical protein
VEEDNTTMDTIHGDPPLHIELTILPQRLSCTLVETCERDQFPCGVAILEEEASIVRRHQSPKETSR